MGGLGPRVNLFLAYSDSEGYQNGGSNQVGFTAKLNYAKDFM